MIAYETGAPRVADPLGGSAYVEWMTDELERRAEAIFAHIEELGHGSMLDGVIAGIENGYFTGEIADASYRFEREAAAGERIIVGVNAFTEGGGSRAVAAVDRSGDRSRPARPPCRAYGATARPSGSRARSRRSWRHARDPVRNVMPAIIDAVHADATLGEVTAALESVFGTYTEAAVA